MPGAAAKPGFSHTTGFLVFVLAAVSCDGELARVRDAEKQPFSAAYQAVSPSPMVQSRRVLSYPIEQVWPTSVRYLRVDRGFSLHDQDQQNGFIIFEYRLDDGRTGRGSLELIRTEDASHRPSVSLVVATDVGPTYLAHSIGEGIASKLQRERGAPPPPAQPPAKPKEPPKATTP